MNKIRNKSEPIDTTQETAMAQEQVQHGKHADPFMSDFNGSRFLSAMPFILFITGLAILYIYNANRAIKIVSESDKISQEIKTYRAEYISVKSELMYKSKQSQIADSVIQLGLQELTEPPLKIVKSEE